VRTVPLVLLVLAVAGCGGGSKHATAAATTTPVPARPAAAAAPGNCVDRVPGNLVAPGPYAVRSAHIALTRRASTSSQIRHIDPSAWYPAPRRDCRFALIVFSHGANGQPAYYAPLLAHLASEGFVVIAPVHPDRIARGDESYERLDDVKFLLDHLRAVTRRIAPGLPGEIDRTRIGIAGHSYGAFVASFEATDEPRIRAAMTMAGPLRPGPADSTKVPVLAMAGGADTLVPARLVKTYYDQLPQAVPHGYAEIAGATHSAYGRHCTVERTCGIVDSYATSFFLSYLYGLHNPPPRFARVHLQTVDMP
jgi:predicted dienelactone hydrolase